MKLFRRYTTILWATFFVLVAFSLCLFSMAVYRRYEVTIELMSEAFHARSVAINHHAENVSDHVRLLQGGATAYLRQEPAGPTPLFRAIADAPDGAFFALDTVPAPYAKVDVPNVSGKGSIQGRPPEFRREVEMALALGPFLRQARTNLAEAACIYYVSAREFIAYYPWQPSAEFHYVDNVLKQEYYLGCLPGRNRDRSAVWSPIYVDQAGLGLMTTCSGPLYDGDRFLGVAAVDLTLSTLQSHVSRFPYPQAQVFLMNEQDEVLAHSALPPPPKDGKPHRLKDAVPEESLAEVTKLLRDEFTTPRRAGGRIFLCEKLQEAPWRLVFVARPRDIVLTCITETTFALAILMGGLGLMLAITMRLTHTNFVAPARRMVEYIEEVGHKPQTPVPAAPREWQPWFEEISRVFREHARMMGELKEQNERLNVLVEELKQAMRERERLHAIETELQAARTIQLAILPRTAPASRDLDLAACMEPAREVGGDFYDYFMIDDHRLAFMIGDVSGKGVPAALFMVLSRTLLKAQAMLGLPAAECVQRTNVLLCGDNTATMFVTLFYGILDLRTGEMEYCNGGHNPPYLIRASGAVEQTELCGGPLLGVDEAAAFQARTIRLNAGDALVLYTDGVTEAETDRQEFYTEARLETALRANATAAARGITEGVLASVREFAAGAMQNDDITLLVMRFRKPEAAPTPAPAALEAPARGEPLLMQLQNELSEVQRLHVALGEFCAREGVPEEALGRMRLAMEEVLVNIMRYAFEDAVARPIRVKVTRHPDRLEALIEDTGHAFNPLAVAAPDLTKPLDRRRIGGLGLHLVRSMVDDVDYCRTKVMNHITLTIKLPSAP
jgi:sigma-B regulation protein RsbU (phosphoserine phosphatase)